MRALLVLLLLGLSACAPTLQAGSTRASSAVVVVENRNWNDAIIYAVRSGAKQRLGRVGTYQTERWVVRVPPDGTLRLLIDLFASREELSIGGIVVVPGDRVELVVENHLALSSIAVR